MKKPPANSSPKQSTENRQPTKQLKIFLTEDEHAIVSTAANLNRTTIRDYLKAAVLGQATQDAKKLGAIIDALSK